MELDPKLVKKLRKQAKKFAKEMARKDKLACKKAMKLLFNKPVVIQLLKAVLLHENRAPLFVENCAPLLKMTEKQLEALLKEIKGAKLVRVVGELETLILGTYGFIAMAAKGNLKSDDPNLWDWKRGFKTLEMELRELHGEPLL
ncbi:MAG: hypothetical protein HYY86_02055 [Candidatus Harrisonbacteria bacterium]|nr:hypothetical protein [Candidatus Harrisonbacteria bacterium]